MGGQPGTLSPPAVRQRVRSWLWDYLVVLCWLLLLFVVLGVPVLLGWLDMSWLQGRRVAGDAVVGLVSVLPYVAYLVTTEASPGNATIGKRRSGLTVRSRDGAVPALGRLLVRNLVKALPWQLGHMAALRFTLDPESTSGILWLLACAAVTLGVVLPPLAGRTGVHDLLARTRVRAQRGAR